MRIPLVRDTIDQEDVQYLIEWLQTNPRLTKGEKTIEFEEKWSKWLGTKYSVYLNSGSSANLAMIYSLILSGKLRNNKIILPSVSWVTTVTPSIQFGLEPILCECDKDTLGIDINHLEELCIKHNPSVIMLVHVLGFPNKMKEIIEICNKYNIILLEDSCESVGSTYDNKKTGTFGLMSSFSFYFGHHMSTIEGGMISTDDEYMYNILLSIRSHGWSRDLEDYKKSELKTKYDVSDFKSQYTFYLPGFNLRSTDLQAYIGLKQLDNLDKNNIIRERNFQLYQENINNDYWKIKILDNTWISNFSYPIIHPQIHKIIENLNNEGIENRPLICGSIGHQPFWIEKYGYSEFYFANLVDDFGMYLPNNHQLTEEEVLEICNIVNESIKIIW